jgi:polyhydroxyalkanoate synthesis regulator phasin
MLDSFRNLLMAGLGAALITRDKVLEVAQKWVDKGSISAAEAEKLADEIMEESKQQARNLGQSIEEAVNSALKNMQLAKASEIEDLEARIRVLEQQAGLASADDSEAGEAQAETAQPGPAADQMPEGD